jgi:hypothetical protein
LLCKLFPPCSSYILDKQETDKHQNNCQESEKLLIEVLAISGVGTNYIEDYKVADLD